MYKGFTPNNQNVENECSWNDTYWPVLSVKSCVAANLNDVPSTINTGCT